MAPTPFGNIMQADSELHIDDATLERYAMGKLDAEREAVIEQHILLCDACRIRATQEVAMSRGMKEAAPRIAAETVPERSRWWSLRLLGPAFAACTLLLLAVIILGPRGFDRSPVAVSLYAMRGAETEAHGPAGKRLLLEPDLNGLAVSPGYRIELVDGAGGRRWQGDLDASGNPPGAIAPAQPAGVYFVRVSSASGQLLREYALALNPGN